LPARNSWKPAVFNDWQALEWKNIEKFRGIVQAHQHLISLRKNQYNNTKGLVSQNFNVLHLNEGDKVLAYHRWDKGGAGDDVMVVINFANRSYDDYWINFPNNGVWKVRFNSSWNGYSDDFENIGVSEVKVENNSGKLSLGSYSVLLLSQ
jgi:1,4-alpha-glucan branching enzyme